MDTLKVWQSPLVDILQRQKNTPEEFVAKIANAVAQDFQRRDWGAFKEASSKEESSGIAVATSVLKFALQVSATFKPVISSPKKIISLLSEESLRQLELSQMLFGILKGEPRPDSKLKKDTFQEYLTFHFLEIWVERGLSIACPDVALLKKHYPNLGRSNVLEEVKVGDEKIRLNNDFQANTQAYVRWVDWVENKLPSASTEEGFDGIRLSAQTFAQGIMKRISPLLNVCEEKNVNALLVLICTRFAENFHPVDVKGQEEVIKECFDSSALGSALKRLSPTQIRVVCEHSKHMVQVGKDFNDVMKPLNSDQRTVVFEFFKTYLCSIVKNSRDIQVILEHLTPEQITDIQAPLLRREAILR